MRDGHQGGGAKKGAGVPGVRPEGTSEAGRPAGGASAAADRGAAGGAGQKSKLMLAALAVALTAPGLACSSTSGGAPGETATTRLYRRQCAACHGPEGAGGQVGSLAVADLRAPRAVAYTDEQLYRRIHDGDKGMPPFKYSLSEQQIHDLVRFIRNDIQRREKK
jgi:mono/diheme cytochrome c family protein